MMLPSSTFTGSGGSSSKTNPFEGMRISKTLSLKRNWREKPIGVSP